MCSSTWMILFMLRDEMVWFRIFRSHHVTQATNTQIRCCDGKYTRKDMDYFAFCAGVSGWSMIWFR